MIGFLGAMVIRTLRTLVRLRHVHPENLESQKQSIIAFWHSHLLLMLYCRFRRPIVVMISQSKDGEYIAGPLRHFGVEAARGSSTRGGTAALREMIRDARAGKNIAFTPDGPKGPARILKDGVIYAAQATGLPIVPIAFAAKKKSCSDRGTGWSSRSRSRARSCSTATRSSCRVMATWKNGAFASNVR